MGLIGLFLPGKEGFGRTYSPLFYLYCIGGLTGLISFGWERIGPLKFRRRGNFLIREIFKKGQPPLRRIVLLRGFKTFYLEAYLGQRRNWGGNHYWGIGVSLRVQTPN